MDLELKDKVVIVTGGAKGIGAAISQTFAREGARTVIVGRGKPEAEALVGDITAAGGAAFFMEVSLDSEAVCKEVIDTVTTEHGQLDVLVNNAGFNDGIALDQPLEAFVGSLKRNLFHVYSLMHFSVPWLKQSKGNVVNLGSKVSMTGQGATSGYAAAKGAITALTREWALALGPHGVRSNAVLPAECHSASYQRWFDSLPDGAATQAAIENMIPLEQRMTNPEEVADMVVFLASRRASHVTGEIILVDGGYTHLDRAFGHEHTKWT